MHISFRTVVLNLRHAGLDAQQIARKVGVSPSAVYQWARGGRSAPQDFMVCLRLLDLHLDRCPERHSWEGLQ